MLSAPTLFALPLIFLLQQGYPGKAKHDNSSAHVCTAILHFPSSAKPRKAESRRLLRFFSTKLLLFLKQQSER